MFELSFDNSNEKSGIVCESVVQETLNFVTRKKVKNELVNIYS